MLSQGIDISIEILKSVKQDEIYMSFWTKEKEAWEADCGEGQGRKRDPIGGGTHLPDGEDKKEALGGRRGSGKRIWSHRALAREEPARG